MSKLFGIITAKNPLCIDKYKIKINKKNDISLWWKGVSVWRCNAKGEINEKYFNESNLFKLITIAKNEIVNVNKPIPPKRPDSINRYKNSLWGCIQILVLGTLPLLTYALLDWKTSLKAPSPCPKKGLSRKISIHAIYKSFLTVYDDELILLIILVDASTFLVRLNLLGGLLYLYQL